MIVPQPAEPGILHLGGAIKGQHLLIVVIFVKQDSPLVFFLHKATWSPSGCTFVCQLESGATCCTSVL